MSVWARNSRNNTSATVPKTVGTDRVRRNRGNVTAPTRLNIVDKAMGNVTANGDTFRRNRVTVTVPTRLNFVVDSVIVARNR